VLAIANLLGILGAAGWLVATERVDRERVEAIRKILHEPAPIERARLESEAAAAAEQQEEQPEPLPPTPPVPSEQIIDLRQDLERADEFLAQRMQRESQDLARTMALERERLEREQAEFERERAEFERMREQIAATEGDAQFKAALSVLKQVKPAEAKAILQEIIDGVAGALGAPEQPGASGMDRAVAYLDALGSMERGEVMAQFVKDSPAMAAELLERLRTFGLVADASGEQGP
ncbi:MAG TPA: hypothetical protein VFF69_06635, partial [Phycisphaerales bacterium]|nr:hypothetical protein [Phycisphaerales bacterium]